MKALELMQEMYTWAQSPVKDTVDTCKSGDPEREISKVATCFIATPEVIKAAHAWGADLLITHEPTYYEHRDYCGNIPDDPVMQAKKQLLDATQMVTYRYHDHSHASFPDGIIAGEVKALDWDCDYDGVFEVKLHAPKTARQMAAEIEKAWGIQHVRMVGDLDAPMTYAQMMIGAFGEDNHLKALRSDHCDVLVVGETSEWRVGEYVRDAHQLGMHKAMLICGHVGSERDGMKHLCTLINDVHPQLDCRYFECGEVYRSLT